MFISLTSNNVLLWCLKNKHWWLTEQLDEFCIERTIFGNHIVTWTWELSFKIAECFQCHILDRLIVDSPSNQMGSSQQQHVMLMRKADHTAIWFNNNSHVGNTWKTESYTSGRKHCNVDSDVFKDAPSYLSTNVMPVDKLPVHLIHLWLYIQQHTEFLQPLLPSNQANLAHWTNITITWLILALTINMSKSRRRLFHVQLLDHQSLTWTKLFRLSSSHSG